MKSLQWFAKNTMRQYNVNQMFREGQTAKVFLVIPERQKPQPWKEASK